MAKLIISSKKLDKSSITSFSFSENAFYSRLISHIAKDKLKNRVRITFNNKTKRQRYEYIPSNEYLLLHSKLGLCL